MICMRRQEIDQKFIFPMEIPNNKRPNNGIFFNEKKQFLLVT